MRASLLVLFLLFGPVAARADDTPQNQAADESQPTDPRQQFNEIRKMLGGGDLQGAEKAFAEALKAHPDSPLLRSLRIPLYSYNMRADKPWQAAHHLSAYLDQLLKQAESGGSLSNISAYANAMVSAYDKAEKPKVGRARLDDIVARLGVLAAAEQPKPHVVQALYAVKGVQWQLRADEEGGADAVAAELKAELAAAQKALANATEAERQSPALRVAALLEAKVDLSGKLDPEGAAAAREAFVSFLAGRFEEQPSDATVIDMYFDGVLNVAGGLARTEPKRAEAFIKDMRKRVADLGDDGNAAQEKLKNRAPLLASIERSIQQGLVHAEMIGKQYFPIEPDAWVNGSPLTPQDLEGKVVLLDFWAVWCGPCIATFPHLREWQEEYGDKGLVIIGVTRYYSYQWDDAAKRSKRVEGLSHEDEQPELVKFAAHHELKHRFAVMPDGDETAKKYGVTGIPQAVLIDRQGKVRMIRVGSGEQNAHDLETMLEKLIDDSSARLDESGGKTEVAEAPVRAPQPELEGDLAGLTVKDRRHGIHLIQARAGNVPKVGEPAPDFTLRTFDGKHTVRLSALQGGRPIVLLFGSLT